MALEKAQTDYVKWLIETGKAVIAGRLTDDGEIRGVYVLRAKTAEEAKALGGRQSGGEVWPLGQRAAPVVV